MFQVLTSTSVELVEQYSEIYFSDANLVSNGRNWFFERQGTSVAKEINEEGRQFWSSKFLLNFYGAFICKWAHLKLKIYFILGILFDWVNLFLITWDRELLLVQLAAKFLVMVALELLL